MFPGKPQGDSRPGRASCPPLPGLRGGGPGSDGNPSTVVGTIPHNAFSPVTSHGSQQELQDAVTLGISSFTEMVGDLRLGELGGQPRSYRTSVRGGAQTQLPASASLPELLP